MSTKAVAVRPSIVTSRLVVQVLELHVRLEVGPQLRQTLRLWLIAVIKIGGLVTLELCRIVVDVVVLDTVAACVVVCGRSSLFHCEATSPTNVAALFPPRGLGAFLTQLLHSCGMATRSVQMTVMVTSMNGWTSMRRDASSPRFH